MAASHLFTDKCQVTLTLQLPPGMTVTAWINGHLCGQGQTFEANSQVRIHRQTFCAEIPGDNSTGCGVPGRMVRSRSGLTTWPECDVGLTTACGKCH